MCNGEGLQQGRGVASQLHHVPELHKLQTHTCLVLWVCTSILTTYFRDKMPKGVHVDGGFYEFMIRKHSTNNPAALAVCILVLNPSVQLIMHTSTIMLLPAAKVPQMIGAALWAHQRAPIGPAPWQGAPPSTPPAASLAMGPAAPLPVALVSVP